MGRRRIDHSESLVQDLQELQQAGQQPLLVLLEHPVFATYGCSSMVCSKKESSNCLGNQENQPRNSPSHGAKYAESAERWW